MCKIEKVSLNVQNGKKFAHTDVVANKHYINEYTTWTYSSVLVVAVLQIVQWMTRKIT